jgi:hypothetical protein
MADKITEAEAAALQEGQRKARLGVMYLYSNMTVSTNAFGCVLSTLHDGLQGVADLTPGTSAIKQHTTGIGLPGVLSGEVRAHQANVEGKVLGGVEKSLQQGAANKLGAKYVGAKGPETEGLFQAMKDFAIKVHGTLKAKFKSTTTWKPLFEEMIRSLVSAIWSQGGGLVSGSLQAVKGVRTALEGFSARLTSHVMMQGVTLNSGYPTVVVEALQRSMLVSAAEGMYGAIRGAGAVVAGVMAPGIGSLINLFVTGAENLFRLFWRLHEIDKMKLVFKRAQMEYGLGRAFEERIGAAPKAQSLLGPEGATPLHADADAFADWFRDAAHELPVLAVLPLMTGLCGDKMTYLSLFGRQDENIITSAEFLRGAEAIDGLKPWARSYLKASGYTFHSSDRLVSNLITAQYKNIEAVRRQNLGRWGRTKEWLLKAAA